MKKIIITSFAFLSVLLVVSCKQNSDSEIYDQPPKWARNAIWYQIFVERFNNGDPTNDPTVESISTASDFRPVPDDWSVTPWTHNWYEQDDWAKNMKVGFYDGLQLRRFGGDLQGILDKLDYLQELGVTALYLNPVNDAPSLHKFDVRNWRHIDINFGPDPEGDYEIIKSEDPADPSTWKWTSADQFFLILVNELHKRDMKIILDFSWNHTGVEFWAWKDIIKNQEKSKYKDWYEITSFDDPNTPENEFAYHGWANLASLPEIKKVDITTEKKSGYPYEGDIYEPVKDHIFAVTERWLAPNGNVSQGIDGYRLDVADHIGMKFWRDWRTYVKSINPEAYLVGEIWWVKWPETLMNPTPYVKGDVFDAVMFYQIYRPARYFFAKTNFDITAQQLVDSMNFQWDRIGKPYRYAMMNTAATHDAPRLLSSFGNPNKYKYNAKPDADPNYITGKPDEETYQRVKLYLMHQFTNIGAPQIWNGDEMGMWGGDDPDCRKPLWWPEFEFDPEYRNNIQPAEKEFEEVGFNSNWFEFYKQVTRIRKENPALSSGEIEFLEAEGKLLSYKRFNDKDEIIVMFNLEKHMHTFKLTSTGIWEDLMTGEIITSDEVLVQPLDYQILKRAE